MQHKELPSLNCTEVVLVGSEESDDPYGRSENPDGTGLDQNLDVTLTWRRKVTRITILIIVCMRYMLTQQYAWVQVLASQDW